MMRMLKSIFTVVLLLVAATAMAAHNFEFRFVEPTQRVDGTPFDAATEAGFYTAQCAVDESFTAPLEVLFERAETIPDGDGLYFLWADAVQTGGWYFCRMSVTDVDGLESNWSAVATVRKTAKQNPPVLR